MSEKLDIIIDQLKNLTLLEAADLVTQIEKTFGIDTSVSISNSANLGANTIVSSTPAVDIVEEKVAFDITLTEVPADKKIAILKIVRTITGLGLKESKDIVDNVPKLIKEGVTKEESEKFKKELEEAGGKVAIK
jgi:large subunit ribosomal protein L7/L12